AVLRGASGARPAEASLDRAPAGDGRSRGRAERARLVRVAWLPGQRARHRQGAGGGPGAGSAHAHDARARRLRGPGIARRDRVCSAALTVILGRMRRALRAVSTVLIVSGSLLIMDAGLTLV